MQKKINMIKFLYIENYAIIDKLEMNFNDGFSIITGETGAGKSILLGAISLIMGKRASLNFLKNKNKKCIVKVSFDIKKYNLNFFFLKYNIKNQEFTILKREISAKGKSTAFINGKKVNLKILNELSKNLIDIHSQNQNLILEKNNFQMEILDIVAKNEILLKNYQKIFYELKKVKEKLKINLLEKEENKKNLDFFQYQFDELEKANLKEDEEKKLEKELNILNNYKEIKIKMSKLSLLIYENENSIVNKLDESELLIKNISSYFPQIGEINKRLKTAKIEMEDIFREAEILNENLEYDKEKTEIISDRLDLIFSLENKHKVQTISELLKIKVNLGKKLFSLENKEIFIKKLENEIIYYNNKLQNFGKKLRKIRKKNVKYIEKFIISQMINMGIINVNFKISIENLKKPNLYGLDEVKFLFSANKKMEMQELKKFASGGEKSRLILSIKFLISKSISLPTIIFDEVDTGISGEISHKMGKIIHKMSKNIQIINITHSPQIASKADFHYLVYKEENENSSNTKIKLLNKKERIIEIAEMLSGENITKASIRNAKELLK